MKDLVLFHGGCYDGFGSAWAAWKALGDNADYAPVVYGKELGPSKYLTQKEYDEIFILDFSYKFDELVELKKRFNASTIVLLDHHKTAFENLENHLCHTWLVTELDTERSGAKITQEYFKERFKWRPYCNESDLIEYISDRYLWQFKLKDSKAVHQYLVANATLEPTEEEFVKWNTFEQKIEQVVNEGKQLLKQYEMLVENICKRAHMNKIAGYVVPVVNTTIAWSEVGNRLLELYPNAPFSACFTVNEKDVKWSLRSEKDFDVSEIAKRYGGGGHKNAAGFRVEQLFMPLLR